MMASSQVGNPQSARSDSNRNAVGPEKQLLHLLLLLGQHGPKLSHQHRAQHLAVTRSLLSSQSVAPSAYRQLPSTIFLALSKFLGTCQLHKNPVKEPDTLVALFALINAACGCLPGNEFAQVTKLSSQLPAFARNTENGLFGGRNEDDADGDDEEDEFIVSVLKLKMVRLGLQDTPEPVRASIAHLVVTACDACGDVQQHGLKIRQMALGTLCAFVRVLPPNLLAIFFPGIASKLAKILTRSRLDQSILAVLSFDALSTLISKLFIPVNNNATKSLHEGDTSSSSSFSQVLEATMHQKRTEQNPLPSLRRNDRNARPHSIEVSERDQDWYTEASRRFSDVLSVILESADSPRFHPNQSARFACAKFLAKCALQKSRIRIDDTVRAECFIVLFECAADQFDEPRELAVSLIRDEIHRCEQDVEKGLGALIRLVLRHEISKPFNVLSEYDGYDDGDFSENSPEEEALRRMMAVQNPQQEEHKWSRLLEGYLYVLGNRGENGTFSPLDILRRVNSEELAVVLVSFQKAVFKPAAIASPDEYELLRNPALSACEQLGKVGLLPSLQISLSRMGKQQLSESSRHEFDDDQGDEFLYTDAARTLDVVHHTDPDAFANHAHVVQCINWLTVGACWEFRARYIDLRTSTEADDWSQLKRYAVDVLKSAAECTLPVDEETFNRSGWNDSIPIRAKLGTLMCTAQLLEIMGKLKTQHRKLGFEIVLPILLSLLVDAAREEVEVQKAAQFALQTLAEQLGYGSVRVLIGKHVNFIVARLTRNLHYTWAAAVLKYIISEKQRPYDDICAQVINLAQDSLVQQCHDLAGASDYRAAITLAAIESVLSTALFLRNSKEDVDDIRHEESGDPLQEEIDELTKHMMSFCTDYTEEDNVVDDNDLNEEEEEERDKSGFEIIAGSALAGIEDLLIGRPAQLRAQALRVAAIGIQVLSVDETQLLPNVAKLLPLIPVQLSGTEEARDKKKRVGKSKSRYGNGNRNRDRNSTSEEDAIAIIAEVNRLGRELPVISAACELMTRLVQTAKTFVQGRFIKMIFPKLRPLLKLLLIRHGERCDVGFGALTAADKAMELLAQVSICLPKAIAPFAEEITHYVIQYLNPTSRTGSAMVGVKGIYEVQRYRNRCKWADSIMKALAKGPAQDLVWTILVVEDSKNNHAEFIEKEMTGNFRKLRIR